LVVIRKESRFFLFLPSYYLLIFFDCLIFFISEKKTGGSPGGIPFPLLWYWVEASGAERLPRPRENWDTGNPHYHFSLTESYIMRRFSIFIMLASVFLCSYLDAAGQVEVRVTVNGGLATTTCVDLIGDPDPLWQVNVNNEGWVVYPLTGACFTALPNVQYSDSYCPSNVPTTLEVCFGAFENDDLLYEIGTGCGVSSSCDETICQVYNIPAPGESDDLTLALPGGLSSGGEVNFIIETIIVSPDNNLICDAIDLGTIDGGGVFGDIGAGIYNNSCADNVNEPNPTNSGSWYNDFGVWFTFTTGSDPAKMIFFDASNDPENTGQEIDIQMALYVSDNNACDGNMSLVAAAVDNFTFDLRMEGRCLMPNTTYFLLVDGDSGQPNVGQGVFGLQLTAVDVEEGADARCDAEALGAVPPGGSVSTPAPRANYCATDTGDPFVQAFVSQASVWFTFIAPPSGHVFIEAVSDTETDPIGLQLALYRAFNDNCASFFSHLGSVYTGADLDETMEATCLYPGQRYFILVDGDGDETRGIFTLTVSDAGDITPVFNQDVTICAGETFSVAGSVYSASGFYSDTLQVFAGCDSIVNTNLTVLAPIAVTVNEIMPALGEGSSNGIYQAAVTGGAGNYSYLWCSGETGSQASMLVGGEDCCVTVTDGAGCQTVECFTVEFVIDIIPTFSNDTLNCHGDTDGVIVFSAINGLPPYNYSWQNQDNTLAGSGVMNAAGEEVRIENLPAGAYTFTVMDNFSDTTFTAMVTEPLPVTVTLTDQVNASCFEFCDGSLTVNIQGGTSPYSLNWNNNLPGLPDPGLLCAGDYSLTVTDENGCLGFLTARIEQPQEFIAVVEVVRHVSCFGGSDGEVTVNTNGNPSQYLWSNGEGSQSLGGLTQGIYEVTVTNEDGCEDIAFAAVQQPAEPVAVGIAVQHEITCFEASDGALSAVVSGPGNIFSYQWSTGSSQPFIQDVPSGQYSVTVANEAGCEALGDFFLQQPEDISAEIVTEDINCKNAPSGGVINIVNVAGGVPEYLYSLDGVLFRSAPTFPGLFEGQYEVVIKDKGGCEKSFSATVMGPPELIVDLGENVSIQQGDSIRLDALVNSSNVLFSWKPDTLGIGGPPSIVVSPLESTAYQVFVTDTVTFCTAADNIFVTVVKDRKIFIPNAFSPNENGANDVFMIFGGVGVKQVKSFRVFSRAGSLVHEVLGFQPNDPAFGWDGRLNGRPLNSGIYVYLAEIEFADGVVEIFKGDVMLMR
jgi:gliding motility-associated-like protein